MGTKRTSNRSLGAIKDFFELVTRLGANLSPDSHPKQRTKFYNGSPKWALSGDFLTNGVAADRTAAAIVAVERLTSQE